MKASALPHFEKSLSCDRLIRIDDQVSLHVFEFRPLHDGHRIPIVIISGLVTIIDSFRTIVEGLSENHPVFYIETRDKTSSVIAGKVKFNIRTMGDDIRHIIGDLGLKEREYAMIGYSFGGPIITECCRTIAQKPLCIIFMEPTAEFNYPGWSLFLIKWFGVPLFPVLKNFAKWYLGKFRLNKKEDVQMALILSDTINNADPVKFRNCILDIAGYKIYDNLKNVTSPSLIVGTSKDGLHVIGEMKRMEELLGNVTYIDLETNERTHNMDMVRVTMDFIGKVTGQSAGK